MRYIYANSCNKVMLLVNNTFYATISLNYTFNKYHSDTFSSFKKSKFSYNKYFKEL